MGHYYEELEAEGKDRRECFWTAVDDFLNEHGNRYSLRSDWLAKADRPTGWGGGDDYDLATDTEDGKPRCYAERLDDVPPLVWKETVVPAKYGRYGLVSREHRITQRVRDPDAPRDQWLQVWRFRVHFHA